MWPFAECSPQFIRSMQRLRCQAKVKAKTLKLHTAGWRMRGWARHYVVFVLKNQMNSGNWKNAATWNVATFLIIKKKPDGWIYSLEIFYAKMILWWTLKVSASFNLCKRMLSPSFQQSHIFTPSLAWTPRLSGSLVSTPASLGLFLYRPK